MRVLRHVGGVHPGVHRRGAAALLGAVGVRALRRGRGRGGWQNGGDRDAALAAHMAVCRRFNGFGRTHQALFQADAVIDIVRRLAGSPRSPKFSAGTRAIGDGAKNGLAGSSGCVALVAGARNDQVVTN